MILRLNLLQCPVDVASSDSQSHSKDDLESQCVRYSLVILTGHESFYNLYSVFTSHIYFNRTTLESVFLFFFNITI